MDFYDLKQWIESTDIMGLKRSLKIESKYIAALKQLDGIGSFEERWPGLAEIIREGQEAERRALSGRTIEEVLQAEREQTYANVYKQVQERIQKMNTIFDKEDDIHDD